MVIGYIPSYFNDLNLWNDHQVTLDRQNREYYACDAGCLDPPVKLSKETRRFPVKLTDPVTAVLYITSDYEHMRELKHTIHVKEVNDGEYNLVGC